MLEAAFKNRGVLIALATGLLLLGPAIGIIEPATASAPWSQKLDPLALEECAAEGHAPVVVMLAEQADLTGAESAVDKAARGRWVVRRLREVAERTQPPVVSWLEDRGVAVKRYFAANALAIDADSVTLYGLARRADVSYVELEGQVSVPEPYEAEGSATFSSLSEPNTPQIVERGVKAIGADEVWDMGYRGEGVVVGIVDTGANHRHPALKYNYRGRDDDHDYDWFDAAGASQEPTDDDSHGTHVTGTAVGEAGARQIGVAPGAEWIACRNIQRRSGDDQYSLDCVEWMLEPYRLDGSDPRSELAPDVVNASWGSRPGKDCAGSRALQSMIVSLRAAGILFVAAAGNSGSKCETVCAPGAYPEVFSVANYDVRRRSIFDSSSRGPVKFYPFDNPVEIVKPDIAAPGTNVNSSIPPSRYDKKSGTSMASPHVTGAVALVLSARPDLRGHPEIVQQMLEGTASEMRPDRCGPAGEDEFNNSAGHGIMDVEAAVEVALSATPPPSPTPIPTETLTPTTGPTATPTLTPEPPTPTPAPVFEIYLPWLSRRAFLTR